MSTILVTGASGFIGRSLIAALQLQPGLRVLALSRTGDAGPQAERLNVALQSLDAEFWRRHGVGAIDVVVHLGAHAPKNAAAADFVEPILTSNVNGTAALLASLPNKPRHFVFASSVDVYKRTGGRPIDETSAVGPSTLHGASKLFGEELVRAYARQTGCAYSILRLGHIFGPGEERYQKVIPNLIRAMLGGAQPELSGDGTTERDFLYVDDAARAIIAAFESQQPADPINVVRGESISILGIAKLIADLTGYQGSFRFSGSNGESLRFDNAGMKRVLGIRTFVSLRDGLAREIADFRRTEFATR